MHHPEHRTWFPFILIGLTFILAAFVFAWLKDGEPETTQIQDYVQYEDTLNFAPSEDTYKEQVMLVIDRFQETENVAEAHADLLEVTVPAAFKDLHVELVLAFTKLLAGDTEGARARFDLLTSEHAWLKL